MARVVAATGLSHAYTFMTTEEWGQFYHWSSSRFERERNIKLPERPEAQWETEAGNAERFAEFQTTLSRIRAEVRALEPDVILSLGDDQEEDYDDTCIPQVAIVTAPEAVTVNMFDSRHETKFPIAQDLARSLHSALVESGMDIAETRSLSQGKLLAHAHSQPLQYFYPEGGVPIVPVFVNGMHMPAPTPSRCYDLGVRIRSVLEELEDGRRILVCASGGLSHFVNSFPWDYYKGPEVYGAVHPAFDQRTIAWFREGEGVKLSSLTTDDLVDHGNVELRQHIVLAGIIGASKPDILAYDVFYRVGLGMWTGYWSQLG